MSDAKHGGPAFPVEWQNKIDAGMTLRDYFAAHSGVTWQDAVNVATRNGESNASSMEVVGMLVEMRYVIADEMLKRRTRDE